MTMQTFPTDVVPMFPIGVDFSFSDNIALSYGGKNRQSISRSSTPITMFTLKFGTHQSTDKQKIISFLKSRKGNYEAFYFRNREEIYNPAFVWLANHVYAENDITIPTTSNGHSYKCTTAGTSHATTQPVWTTGDNAVQPTDGNVVWTENAYIVALRDEKFGFKYIHHQLYESGEITLIETS